MNPSWDLCNRALATGTGSGGDATGDSFSGFEGIIGYGFNDNLTGSSGADSIFGGSGKGVDKTWGSSSFPSPMLR
jgi:hypothetical protein